MFTTLRQPNDMSADSFACSGSDSEGRHIYALRIYLQGCRHNGNDCGLHIDSTGLHAIRAHIIQHIHSTAVKLESTLRIPSPHDSVGKAAAMHQAVKADSMICMSGIQQSKQLVTHVMILRAGAACVLTQTA